ncbi:hypothetical protein As57867_019009, partial [Aphanomyces stellatus]
PDEAALALVVAPTAVVVAPPDEEKPAKKGRRYFPTVREYKLVQEAFDDDMGLTLTSVNGEIEVAVRHADRADAVGIVDGVRLAGIAFHGGVFSAPLEGNVPFFRDRLVHLKFSFENLMKAADRGDDSAAFRIRHARLMRQRDERRTAMLKKSSKKLSDIALRRSVVEYLSEELLKDRHVEPPAPKKPTIIKTSMMYIDPKKLAKIEEIQGEIKSLAEKMKSLKELLSASAVPAKHRKTKEGSPGAPAAPATPGLSSTGTNYTFEQSEDM